MQRIELDKDVKPISEFRANATTLLDQVGKTKRPLVITQHGKSAAILMDVKEYEALIEKIELLTDIAAAEDDIKSGRLVPQDNVKARMQKRR